LFVKSNRIPQKR